MITETNPLLTVFRRNTPLRTSDLGFLADGIDRAGRLLGGGQMYGTSGTNPIGFVPTPFAKSKGFWGKVFIKPSGDYTDERYFIFKQRATGGANVADQITREDDPPPKDDNNELMDDWPITASNRAEIKDHTHLLPDEMEVWVTAEWDAAESPTLHYSFSAVAPGTLTVKDCPASTSISATSLRFAGGFTVTDATGGEVDIFPNFIPDPAHPGIIITNGDGVSCQPVKIGLDCSVVVADVRYVGGVFEKLICGVWTFVFATNACPSPPPAGVPAADFFAYNS